MNHCQTFSNAPLITGGEKRRKRSAVLQELAELFVNTLNCITFASKK
jgi:hypothetical protein